MLTLFCLARGSERFHKNVLESSLYQKTVGAYERDKALTLRTKLSILASVTTIMAIGAYFSQNMPNCSYRDGPRMGWSRNSVSFYCKTKK